MPRSKREKEVSLTKVKKKTRETKERLAKEAQQCVDNYKNLLVFTIEEMRSNRFREVRQAFKETSRFFFGKGNVLSIALGKTESDEYAKDLYMVSATLKGQCGLMFTNLSVKEVLKRLEEMKTPDFARAGQIAPKTIELPEGPLPQFPFSMDGQLRKLGMPNKLVKGEIELYQPFEVCKEGQAITIDQAKILKLLNIKLSYFHVTIKGHWNKKNGYKAL